MASSSEQPPSKKPAQSKVQPNLTDFKKIATRCPDSLVDKTELISHFLSGGRLELITAPPRFGKSVNLTMFRCFFEIAVDAETGMPKSDPSKAVTDTDNYHLFSQLGLDVMQQTEIVQQHLGRHPVLYVSFKCDVAISSVDDATSFCKGVVHDAFIQHEYLYQNKESEALTENEQTYCENWCSPGHYELMDPTLALKELARYLYKYFKRDVVFLVDEYDSLVARAMVEGSGRSVEEICGKKIALEDAKDLLESYQSWKESTCEKFELTPTLLKQMCKVSVHKRTKMCEMYSIDAGGAEKFVARYEKIMQSHEENGITFDFALRLINAHENKIEDICKQPVDMISTLVKTDDQNIHLLGALVTGVSFISGIGWSGGANNITPSKFTDSHKFNCFYGFQLPEINALLQKLADKGHEMEKNAIDIIKDRYNGYQYQSDDSVTKIFCPWSVLNYILTKTPKFFWRGSAYTEPLDHMFEDRKVRSFINGLFSGDAGTLPVIDRIGPGDLAKLKEHVLGKKTTERSQLLFLNFMVELGYMTCDYSVAPVDRYISVGIPSVEVKFLILDKMKEYCKSKLSEDFKFAADNECVGMLQAIDKAANRHESDADFDEAVKTFRDGLQRLFCLYAECLPDINEPLLHCFTAEILTTGRFKYIIEHTVGTELNRGRLDLLGFANKFAILIELKYFPSKKKTASDALQQIMDKEYYKAFEHSAITALGVTHNVVIGISVNKNNKMGIAAVRNYEVGREYKTVTCDLTWYD